MINLRFSIPGTGSRAYGGCQREFWVIRCSREDAVFMIILGIQLALFLYFFPSCAPRDSPVR